MSNGSGPAALLRHRDFRHAWVAGALAGVMRWLEVPVIGLWVFQTTGSPLQVSLVLLLRMLPNFLFGVFAGAIADRFNRKRILIGALATLALVFVGLALLAAGGSLTVWQVASGVFISGCFWSMDFPVRRNLIGEIAGLPRLGAAMGLDAVTTNATRMAGPVVGGILFELYGIQGAYFLGAALFATSALLILSIDYRQSAAGGGELRILANIVDGLRFVRSSPTIQSVLLVTLAMNVFALPYQTMVPVIGGSTLDLSASGVGMLFAAEGLGALISALAITWFVQPRHYMRLYLGGSVLCSAMVLLFALSEVFELALPLLLVSGLGFAAFGSMQGTLIFACPPPRYRRRVSGVLAVSIGTAPLGTLHLGLLAEHLGASTAVAIAQVESLLALALIAFLFPRLWTGEGARALERELADGASAEA